MIFELILIVTLCLYLSPKFAHSPLLRGIYAVGVVILLLCAKASYSDFCLSLALLCGYEGRWNAEAPRTRREWFFRFLTFAWILLTFVPHFFKT